jgi:antitoxin component YwqK of YwqJK toxin-antitoxin module
MAFRKMLLICSVLFASVANGQYLLEQSEQERIAKNDIEIKTEWEHSVKDGKVSSKGKKMSETIYDDAGRILEKKSYRYNGSISSKVTYKYNSNGDVIEHLRFDGRKNQYTLKRYIQYDRTGNIIKEHGKNGPNQTFENNYSYDNRGNLTQITYYSGDRLIESRKIKYSHNKREIHVYNGAGQLTRRIVKKTDDRDNVLEEIQYTSSNQIKKRFVYKYDDRDNQIMEEKYYSGNLTLRVSRLYDNDDNLIEVIHETPDRPTFTNNFYIYDSRGKLMEEKWYSESKNDYSSKKYTYNNSGNVVKANCYYAQFGSEYVYKYRYE